MSDTLLRQWQLLRAIPRAPRRKSVSELLDHLAHAGYQLTKRTLQRDLNMLSATFPLQCDTRSIPFGWSWSADSPSLDLPTMDSAEALMLKMVQHFIPTLMPPDVSDYLRPYFTRADEVLKQSTKARRRHWLDCVRVVPREMPLLPPTVNAAVTRVVYQALAEGKRFVCDYISRETKDGEPKQYEVNPLGIVVRGSLVYLVCTLWKFTDIRQLALHRIKAAEIIDKSTSRPASFNLDEYIAQGEFQYPVGPMIELKAIFDCHAAAHLYETPLSNDQQIVAVDDKRVMVTATVRETEQLRWWLRGFGAYVEVLHPRFESK